MKDGMRLAVLREIPDDPGFRDQWNALAQAIERPQVFYTHEWALAFSRAFSDELLLFAAYRGAALAGVVALSLDRRRNAVSFLTAPTADYCDFVSAEAERAEFIGLVIAELKRMGIAVLRLPNLPADSASVPALHAALRMAKFSMFLRPGYLCAQAPLGTFEERRQILAWARAKLRRMSKASAELGAITVSHGGTMEEFAGEFPHFAAAHVARFLTTERISNLVRDRRRQFLIELAELLLPRGWLAFSTLKLDGRTIAWNYGFRFGGSWFWYQPAFEVDVQRASPGTFLLCDILYNAAEDPGTSTVDMGLGDEDYKRRYAKSGRQTLHFTAALNKAQIAWERCRYRAADTIRSSPRLDTAIRARMAQVAAFRKRVAGDGLARCCKYYFSRAQRFIFDDAKVFFFEWAGTDRSPFDGQFSLQPVSIPLLAAAAMAYENEEDTLQYLLRSAKRMRAGREEGYSLVNAAGVPVHFSWVAPFEKFYLAELKQVLAEPAAESILLFDCWTPRSQRGHGYYGQCTSQVAARLSQAGKRAWIFSAEANPGSLHGIERAGFMPRFSLLRRRRLFLDRISKLDFKGQRTRTLDLSPAA